MLNRFGAVGMVVAAAACASACNADPAPAGNALVAQTAGTTAAAAPSRQTFDDSLKSKLVRAGGSTTNGAGTVGGAVSGTLGIQGGAALAPKVGQIGSQMAVGAVDAGSPTFQGPTTIGSK